MKAFLKRNVRNAVTVGALLFGLAGFLHSAQSPAQTQRYPQFQNDDVKVWKSLILPNRPLPLHRHDHPRVIVALKGGTMNIVQHNGPTERHIWKTGNAYWLPANLPNTLHTDVNAGSAPVEVIVVELEKEK